MKIFDRWLCCAFCVFSPLVFGDEDPAWEGMDYPSSYVDVLGSKMHFVDSKGEGDPILLVHGIPSSSYLWRNVIPEITQRGRVIAVDLIGFGKSDKPKISYKLKDQTRYFDAFVKALGLENITLVLHDMGSYVGLNYAMNHPEAVKAIVCMESMLTLDTFESMEPQSAAYMRRVRDDHDFLFETMVKEVSFAIGMIPMLTKRSLGEPEIAAYSLPFQTLEQRKTLMPLILDFPISGEPKKSHEAQVAYIEKLKQSVHPKLVLSISEPLIGTKEQMEWVAANLKNVTITPVGEGRHFMQEDQPEKIGQTINRWMIDQGL